TTVLAEYGFGLDLWIDAPRLHSWLMTTNPYPGRPAVATAIGFLLAGGAFLELGRTQAIARALIACVALIGLSALAGNSLGLGAIYPDYPLAEMSFPTAGAFVLVALAQWRTLALFEGYRPLWRSEAAGIIATGASIVLIIGAVSAVGGFVVMQKRTEAVLQAWLAENLANRVSLVREEAAERLRAAG